MGIRKGQQVALEVGGQRVTGTTEGDPKPFPGGDVVGVKLDAEFAHLAPTGSVNVGTNRVAPRG